MADSTYAGNVNGAQVTDPNPAASASDKAPNPDGNGNNGGAPKDDKAAKAERWSAMKSRQEHEAQIRAEYEARKILDEKKSAKFDAKNDPEGTLEMDNRAEIKAREIVAEELKKLGIEGQVKELKTEHMRKEFLGKMEPITQEYSKLGLKTDMKKVADTLVEFENDPGLTHEQLLFVSHMSEIKALLGRKAGFTPGGGSPAPVAENTPKTHEELVLNALKKRGFEP